MQTLARLAQFKSKMVQSITSEAKETDADDEKWFSHELKFEKDLTKKVQCSAFSDFMSWLV